MKENKKGPIDEWLNNFNLRAVVTYKDKEYTMTEPELKSIYSTAITGITEPIRVHGFAKLW